MTAAKQLSLFAQRLARLFDETGVFTRADWARVLGTEIEMLEDWTSDRGMPRPDLIAGVLDVLNNTDGAPMEPMLAFEELYELPAKEISPHSAIMGPNLKSYLTHVGFESVYRLRGLSPFEQVLVLRGTWYPPAIAALCAQQGAL